jgi:hypothetical protein
MLLVHLWKDTGIQYKHTLVSKLQTNLFSFRELSAERITHQITITIHVGRVITRICNYYFFLGGGGVGVRGWPYPEERSTRTPDSGSGHTPARGKTKKREREVWTQKVWRPLLKYVMDRISMVPLILYARPKN